MPLENAPEDELQLVERAKAGDRDAWDRLYALYKEDLRVRVRGQLGAGLRARLGGSSDLLQSAWGDAIGGLEKFEYRGDGSFLAWIATITRNKIARKARKANRSDGPLGGTEGLEMMGARLAAQTGPGTNVEKKEDLQQLTEALDSLRESDREVLTLSWFQGLKHREIAERLAISEDAARMRVSRAEAALTNSFRRLRFRRLRIDGGNPGPPDSALP